MVRGFSLGVVAVGAWCVCVFGCLRVCMCMHICVCLW